MKSREPITARQVALVSLGILFGGAALEFGMRAAGSAFSFLETRAAYRPGWETADLRILCLGESTTAPTPISDHSWPAQLEKILNNAFPQKRHAVINAGRSATNTAVLTARLPSLLERFQPHLVIAMAGVNDSTWYGIVSLKEQNRPQRLLLGIKMVKLSRWAAREFVRGGQWNAARRKLGLLGKEKQLFPDALNNAAVLKEGFRRFRDPALVQQSAFLLTELHFRRNQKGLADPILRSAVRFETNSPAAVFDLGYSGDPGGSGVTVENLKTMRHLSEDHGTRFVLMQYPTRDASPLQEAFPDALVIENRINFESALKNRPYLEIFADRFGGNWGHATADGHRLIAENTARVIAPLLNTH